MDYLKEMIEDLVNENTDNARVTFHSHLQGRMSSLTESHETELLVSDKTEDDLTSK